MDGTWYNKCVLSRLQWLWKLMVNEQSTLLYKRLEYTHGFVSMEMALVLQIFLCYYIQNVLVKNFLIFIRGHNFAIFVDVCDFIAEYWIQIVLMNLQYFAWISIKVTQDGATMVQVISLNPAGWSAERMINFIAIFMKSLCDKQCISCMSSCRFCIKAASNILCHRIWSTMLVHLHK